MPALYDVAIPAFIRGLKNLSNMLEKGSAFAAEQGMPLSDLLDARLIDDMAPLTRQVQILLDAEASRNRSEGAHIFGGDERPPHY